MTNILNVWHGRPKLASMFGPKANYDDDEVRAMISALEADP